MPWFRREFLRRVDTRVIVAVYLVIMVVFAALTMEATKRGEAAAKEDLLHHSHALSEALEAVIVDPLYYRDVDKIKDIITRVAREEPRVLYIYVLDPKGRVLADSEGGKYLGIIFDDEIGRKALEATDALRTYTQDELIVTHPIILQDKMGIIRMGFSLEKMKEYIAQIYFRNIMVMAALFLVTIPPIYLVIRREISEPMDELIQTVTELKNGNLRARTRIKTDSEMDVLAKSFNEMADSMEKNSKELYNAYNELKSLDELKRNIITNVSHELRTPHNHC